MKGRRLLIPLLAALACLVGGVHEAKAASTQCFGSQADPSYMAAFDLTHDGKRGNGVYYPEGRFLIEYQTWATPTAVLLPNGTYLKPGHHSEHFHVKFCVPNAQTMTGPFDLDVLLTFHHVVDYKVFSVAMSRVSKQGSDSLFSLSAAQLADVQKAMEASADGTSTYAFSVRTNPPKSNGIKEIRGGIAVEADGPGALFQEWHTDARWYINEQVAGLPTVEPLGNQRALRVRPIMTFPRLSDGMLVTDYHHFGFCDPADLANTDPATLTLSRSSFWKKADVAKVWSGTHDICLYQTDGGTQYFVEIDPNHHDHCDPAPECEAHPLVETGTRFGRDQHPGRKLVSIPVGTYGFAPGSFHKIAVRDNDFPECAGRSLGVDQSSCPDGVRASWTNVVVLPFKMKPLTAKQLERRRCLKYHSRRWCIRHGH